MIRFNKGDDFVGRPIGTKNVMRTPEEKEKLVLEYFDSKVGYRRFAESNDIYPSIFAKWIKLYRENGIEGLKSKTGKIGTGKGNFKKSEIEQLKEDLLKKEIELMRLKKGYVVKGVGAKKEYVFISNVNTK
jgi:transposase-like protein